VRLAEADVPDAALPVAPVFSTGLLRASRMAAIAGDFRFVGSRILAQLTAIFLSLGGNAQTGRVGALFRFLCCHHEISSDLE